MLHYIGMNAVYMQQYLTMHRNGAWFNKCFTSHGRICTICTITIFNLYTYMYICIYMYKRIFALWAYGAPSTLIRFTTRSINWVLNICMVFAVINRIRRIDPWPWWVINIKLGWQMTHRITTISFHMENIWIFCYGFVFIAITGC